MGEAGNYALVYEDQDMGMGEILVIGEIRE